MYPMDCGHELCYLYLRISVPLEMKDRSCEESHIIEYPGGFDTDIKCFGRLNEADV